MCHLGTKGKKIYIYMYIYIYLFDIILATSCSVRKQIICFKVTEFMFHNHIQMIKYSHFHSLKIKTYLNIALEGRLSIFDILFNLQKCLIKE